MQRSKLNIIGRIFCLILFLLALVVYCYAQGPTGIGGAGSYDYKLSHAAEVTMGTYYKDNRYAWDASGNLEYKGVNMSHEPITASTWTIFKYYWDASDNLIEKRVREKLRWSEKETGW